MAWRGQEQAAFCLEAGLAALAVVASQALHVTKRLAPPALRELLSEVQLHVPPVEESRPIAPDMERLVAALRSGVYGPGATIDTIVAPATAAVGISRG
jgi:histidine ammonia-lyase